MSVSSDPHRTHDDAVSAGGYDLADPRAMSFGEHLEELRRRLIYALLSLVPVFVICLAFGTTLLEMVLRPAQAQLRAAQLPVMLQATGPMETFGAWIKVALAATIIVGVPVALYQLWLFIAPGLYVHERRFARFLAPFALLLSALGLIFLYYVLLPVVLAFFLNFGAGVGQPRVDIGALPPGVHLPAFPVLEADPPDPPSGAIWFNSELQQLRINTAGPGQAPAIRGTPMTRAIGIAQQFRISQYLTLVFNMSLAVALGFQMPVAVLLLGWGGFVTAEYLGRNRRYAIVICAVAAAILTPPDPLTLVLLSVPLWLLYELGVLLLRVLPPSRVASGVLGREPIPQREPRDAGDE
jgi:sec-independent protein translocase protein TatC